MVLRSRSPSKTFPSSSAWLAGGSLPPGLVDGGGMGEGLREDVGGNVTVELPMAGLMMAALSSSLQGTQEDTRTRMSGHT